MSASDTHHVTVVGAGIVGVTTALELRRRGFDTLLLDRTGPATGCSFGNGGAIGPNTCIPFAVPGILRKIPGWYCDPDGPVTVSPSWALKSIPWMLRWIASSRMAHAKASGRGMQFLFAGCLDAYRKMLGPELSASLLREKGYLYLYESPAPSESERTAEAIRAELGIATQTLTADEVRELEPDLTPTFKRGVHLPGNGHTVDPKRLVESLFRAFLDMGGTYAQDEVREVVVSGNRVTGLMTEKDARPVEQLVVCAGIGSRGLAAALGKRLPLVSERGYHVLFPDSPVRLTHKIMNGSRGFGATTMDDGLQITGTVELDSPDTPPSSKRAAALERNARTMFREEAFAGKRSDWMGNRPSLPDSLPVIDRSPRCGNAIFNFGHSHWGLSGAPRSAAFAADLVQGRTLPSESTWFSCHRFAMRSFFAGGAGSAGYP